MAVLGAAPKVRDLTLAHALQHHVTRGMALRSEHMWMEFGVYSGYTAGLMAERLQELSDDGMDVAHLYGFDSFQGLPEDWQKGYRDVSAYQKGEFSNRKAPFVHPKVRWVKGWYNESLPRFLQRELGRHRSMQRNVTLLHMDADLYSSTAPVLELLEPLIAPGCLVDFGELVNYPTYWQGELWALCEFVHRSRRTIEVLAGPEIVELYPTDRIVELESFEATPGTSSRRENVLVRVL